MKAQTKALVASVVVIALALSAVSGITYSWFSDTEQSEVVVTTAVVDLDPQYEVAGTSSIGTTLTKGDITGGVQSFTLSNLAANQHFTIISEITNKSTVKTVYRMYATYDKTGSDMTDYDIQNISINGAYFTSEKGTTANPLVITDWKTLEKGISPSPSSIVVATPTTYGDYKTNGDGTPSAGYVLPDGTLYSGDWNAQTARSGLTINIIIEAYQGDYPTTSMVVETTGSGEGYEVKATAELAGNKVIEAKEIGESVQNSTKKVTDVVVNFSNVSTYDVGTTTGQDVSSKTIEMKINSISDSETAVELTLKDGTTTIESPEFNQPVVITMTVPGAIAEPKITYNGKTDGEILSSTISSDSSTTTIVFSVKHFSTYVIADSLVMDEAGLKKSLAAGGYVKLGADLKNISETITVGTAAVLDLAGHTISTNATYSLIEVKADLEVLNGTLQNSLAIDSSGNTGRVLNIQENSNEIELTLVGVNVVGPTGNSLNRGISAYGNTGKLTINISGGSEISANHYALNIAGENTGGVSCKVSDSVLTGYAAVQSWSKADFTFTNCTLNGGNQWSGDQDGFATVVVEEDAAGTTMKFESSLITAMTTGEAHQNIFGLRSGCEIELKNCGMRSNGEPLDWDTTIEDYTSVNAYNVSDAETEADDNVQKIICTTAVYTEVSDESGLRAAVSNGGYIRLTQDITGMASAIEILKDVVLDLNHHQMTFTNASLDEAVKVSGGSLAVYEIYDDGFKSKMTTAGAKLFVITNGGLKLTVDGGTYEAKNVVVYYEGYYYDDDWNFIQDSEPSTVELWADFKATEASSDSYTIEVLAGVLNIYGGTYYSENESCIQSDLSQTTIYGGTFGKSAYVVSQTYGDLTIYGGSFTGEAVEATPSGYVVLLCVGDCNTTIYGGSFNVKATQYGKASIFGGSDVNITVSGGEFEMDAGTDISYGVEFDGAYGGSISLTGGSYNFDPEEYVAEGYEATNGDGTYTVKEKSN